MIRREGCEEEKRRRGEKARGLKSRKFKEGGIDKMSK